MNAPARRILLASGPALILVLAAILGGAPAYSWQVTVKAGAASNAKSNLPPCNMDSFVYQAGAQAESIYGDESHAGPPPIYGFSKASRINAGITGTNDAGLTTGHGSYMPCAWGADEFLAPPGEWDQSGPTGNTGNLYGQADYNTVVTALDPTSGGVAKGTSGSDQTSSSSDNTSDSQSSNSGSLSTAGGGGFPMPGGGSLSTAGGGGFPMPAAGGSQGSGGNFLSAINSAAGSLGSLFGF